MAGVVSGAAGGANAYEMSQNLLALARLSGASKVCVSARALVRACVRERNVQTTNTAMPKEGLQHNKIPQCLKNTYNIQQGSANRGACKKCGEIGHLAFQVVCVRARVRVRACVHACVRACERACVRTCVRAVVRGCVCTRTCICVKT